MITQIQTTLLILNPLSLHWTPSLRCRMVWNQDTLAQTTEGFTSTSETLYREWETTVWVKIKLTDTKLTPILNPHQQYSLDTCSNFTEYDISMTYRDCFILLSEEKYWVFKCTFIIWVQMCWFWNTTSTMVFSSSRPTSGMREGTWEVILPPYGSDLSTMWTVSKPSHGGRPRTLAIWI